MKWQYPLVPRFYNPVDEYDSFSRLIIINSINTASTHEQSATGICYLQNSRTLPDWIASRTDYQSITTNLCCTGTSSSLWYLWGTSVYSAEKATLTVNTHIRIDVRAIHTTYDAAQYCASGRATHSLYLPYGKNAAEIEHDSISAVTPKWRHTTPCVVSTPS